MDVAFSAPNLHVISLKKLFPMTTLALFSAPGVGQDKLCCDQPSTWNLRVNSDWKRGPRGEGVMDISAWYQLFLCGQIHHKLTDVRCSLSRCCVGCVRSLRRSIRDSEVCQPNTSSINVIDDVINRNQSEWIYYRHLTQPLDPQWSHPHTQPAPTHISIHTLPHTFTKDKLQLSLTLIHTHTSYRC